MIKLTGAMDAQDVWVLARNIVYTCTWDMGRTKVHLVSGDNIQVLEKPEDVVRLISDQIWHGAQR